MVSNPGGKDLLRSLMMSSKFKTNSLISDKDIGVLFFEKNLK